MILLGEPKDKANYIFIEFDYGVELHKSGIIPIYKDIRNDGFWFNKEDIKGGEK